MPSRKEIQWSQLKVGALIVAAMAVLVGLIFLMSGSTGGLFAPKIMLRSYFANASGLKNGAPVTLEGVTIGNVIRIRVVPERNPNPVEVTMKIGSNYLPFLHTDSTTAIAQAGVLGDSYVDITSATAHGPVPPNNTELRATGSPSISDVIRTSQVSIEEVTLLVRKLSVLADSLNSNKGTVGTLINDRQFAAKLSQTVANLQKITDAISNGQGSLGKLVNDDSLYTKANATVDSLNKITTSLEQGQGTAGKLLKDNSLYSNLNATAANANKLLSDINDGKGALGKAAKDPEFARKLDDTVTQLDAILKGINEGKGSLGQLAQNRELYDNANGTLAQSQELVKSIRENPKKYLVIHLKIF
ncbi:MAG: MlaD family protein [Terracidiphilus sp.]|nr:MlaD family protein [Terracidiphilus sp.]